MSEDPSELRVDYADVALDTGSAGRDPMRRFAEWFDDATTRPSVVEPNAMSIATTGADGTPSVRMVLLKHVDPARAAFACYTNLDGRKAREALTSARAALCWWWPGDPARQVRVVGRVEPVERDRAARYFQSRPLAARIGAVASPQSRAIRSRSVLDELVDDAADRAEAIPDGWGGLWVVADELELWQGRAGRVHDRITFLRLDADGRPCSSVAVDAAGGEARLRDAGTEVVDEHGSRWLRARLAP
jgi:pyridoxamine 5'-phosphate oxidase